MEFDVSTLGYIQKTQSIILDYAINIKKLKPNDQIFDSGALGNFSLAGFEMVNESIQTLTKLNNTLALIWMILMLHRVTRNRQTFMFPMINTSPNTIIQPNHPQSLVDGVNNVLVDSSLVCGDLLNNTTLSSDARETFHLVHHHLLPPLRPVRGRLLDLLPHPPRHRPRPHGPPDHPLPCPGQYLQQHQLELAQGRGPDRH